MFGSHPSSSDPLLLIAHHVGDRRISLLLGALDTRLHAVLPLPADPLDLLVGLLGAPSSLLGLVLRLLGKSDRFGLALAGYFGGVLCFSNLGGNRVVVNPWDRLDERAPGIRGTSAYRPRRRACVLRCLGRGVRDSVRELGSPSSGRSDRSREEPGSI
jgi:hypothetical protein